MEQENQAVTSVSSFSFAVSVSPVRSGLRLSPSAGRSGSGGMCWRRKCRGVQCVIGDEKGNHSLN